MFWKEKIPIKYLKNLKNLMNLVSHLTFLQYSIKLMDTLFQLANEKYALTQGTFKGVLPVMGLPSTGYFW